MKVENLTRQLNFRGKTVLLKVPTFQKNAFLKYARGVWKPFSDILKRMPKHYFPYYAMYSLKMIDTSFADAKCHQLTKLKLDRRNLMKSLQKYRQLIPAASLRLDKQVRTIQRMRELAIHKDMDPEKFIIEQLGKEIHEDWEDMKEAKGEMDHYEAEIKKLQALKSVSKAKFNYTHEMIHNTKLFDQIMLPNFAKELNKNNEDALDEILMEGVKDDPRKAKTI